MNYLIDTHSHIYAEEFDADRDEAIRRAREAGVERLLLPAIDSESHGRLFDTVRRYPDHCTPMMGLHPTSINDNPRWREELALVERYLCSPPEGVGRFCAVGEIGLDYYWDDRFKAEQLEAFTKQCRLAATYDLPVAIHTRAAWKDMCRTVETETKAAREKGLRLRGVFHAFAEDADTYRQLKECGDFLFGVGGVGGCCVEALARAGVGTLHLYDDDTVSESNLNRQLAALHSTIGQPKAEVMAQRVMAVTGATDEYKVAQMVQVVNDLADYCRKNGITDGSCGMRSLIDWINSTEITGDPYRSALCTIISKATSDPEDRETLKTAILEPIFAPKRRRTA